MHSEVQYIDIPALRPPLRLADLFAVELALFVLRGQHGEAASRPEAQDATHADDATSGALTTPPHGNTKQYQCLPKHAGQHQLRCWNDCYAALTGRECCWAASVASKKHMQRNGTVQAPLLRLAISELMRLHAVMR